MFLFLLFLYLYFKKSFQSGNVRLFKEMINTFIDWVSLVAQMVKSLPAMQETSVQSLSWEDPLEKGTATHSSIPAWRIPWTEEPSELQSMGLQRVRHDWATNTFQKYFSTFQKYFLTDVNNI